MSNVLRLAIVDPTDATRNALKAKLLGLDKIWLEAECSRYEFFADVIAQTHPDIGIVAIDQDPDKGLRLVEQIAETTRDSHILVVSSSTDGNLILRAMRAGAKEFLSHPIRVEDLVGALERISDRRFGRGENKSRGSCLIAVAGATGGVGTTSIAVNLGCILAADPKNTVALIDQDLTLGDADVFLDTIPDYTLVDVAQNVTRLDFSLLKRSLTKHASGLYLLPRPVQLADAALIKPEDLQRVISLMKATFSHLIIDLSKGYTPNDLIAMEMAGQILLVTQLDLPCLRNAVRLLSSFGEISGLKEKVKVVVNRVGLDQAQISLKKAQETIGREIFWQLPNDYRVMIDVRNNGVPLIEQAPKAAITQALVQMAEALTANNKPDGAEGEGKATKSRWLSLFGGRSKA